LDYDWLSLSLKKKTSESEFKDIDHNLSIITVVVWATSQRIQEIIKTS